MPETDALERAVVRAARTLPGTQLDQLADALGQADGPTAGLRARATALFATDVFVEAVTQILDAWSDGNSLTGPGVALALRASAEAAREERDEEEIEIVWTGPTTSAVALRRTRVVLFELVRGARSRITLVSYAAFRQDDLVDELRSAARRGVRVRLVLESAAASRGRLDRDAARAFSALEGTVEVLEWPAALRGDTKAAGVLHAKAVVVDGRSALVSSANLTAAALDHNIELGLLVRGGGIPRRLEEHVAELRAKGILRPVVAD
jgi:phosphatidylserine/phosphatidylglycerophosphate/cardiolipin synthase-like enzyme